MFIASLTIWLLCRNIVQKPVTDEAAQSNLEFENEELAGGEKIDSEEALIYEEDLDGGDGVEGELEESTRLKMFRRLAFVASKLKEFIGNMITTAGKVVVTILLGSSGMMLPSLTSSVYFFVFLGLCTWWSWCRTFDPLLFSCLCVLLAIFTAGHLIGLYLYQFQFFQEAVPPSDYYASDAAMSVHITSKSKQNLTTSKLQAHVLAAVQKPPQGCGVLASAGGCTGVQVLRQHNVH
ncbi:hypothetical protein H8958_017317 [Nasalis larvatus]